jgi:hypothetical protein
MRYIREMIYRGPPMSDVDGDGMLDVARCYGAIMQLQV